MATNSGGRGGLHSATKTLLHSAGTECVMSDFNLNYRQIGDLGNKIGGDEGAKRFLSGEFVLVDRAKLSANPGAPRLQLVQVLAVPGGKFVTQHSLTKANLKVKFSYIDERLLKQFGQQEDVPAISLAVHSILRDSHAPEIMVAVGPQSKRFIMLGQLYRALEAQGQGQKGPLLVNGYTNIAYILDENGAPWAVRVLWYDGGWHVYVDSVACQDAWLAGFQALSQVA